MIKLAQRIGLFLFLSISIVHAEKPATMPKQAAQDLDYALLKRTRKIEKLVKEFQEKIKAETAAEQKIIDEITKKYEVTLQDGQGNPLDMVDPETGKITRYQPPATSTPKAKSEAKR